MKCTQYYKIHNITNISIYRYKKCSSSVVLFMFFILFIIILPVYFYILTMYES